MSDVLLSGARQQYVNVKYTIGSNGALEELVRLGRVVIGRLCIYSKYDSGLSFVRSRAFPSDVVVRGPGSTKRALNNDIVAVRLLPEEEWDDADGKEHESNSDEDGLSPSRVKGGVPPDGRPIRKWVSDVTTDAARDQEVRLAKDMLAPMPYNWNNKKPVGVIVAILERKHPLLFVARLADGALAPGASIGSSRYYRFKVYNPLLPFLAVFGRTIPSRLHEGIDERFYLLRIQTGVDEGISWVESRFPVAKIECVLGSTESLQLSTFAMCSANDILMTDFSEEAQQCIPSSFSIPALSELEQAGRRDLRETEFVCSIDPVTARDLDDALSITVLQGGYRVGVHIADVTHFVVPGSALDEEARARTTSIYLVDRVYPMLPRRLSEEYCSLHPGSDKLAFSALFTLDSHGKVKGEWFGKSVIRNRCRLSYDDAQRIIDGDRTVLDLLDYGGVEDGLCQLKERVQESVKNLFRLASILRAASIERGRVTLTSARAEFQFEDMSNPTRPVGFRVRRGIEANWLVEEFMLLANAQVCKKITEYLPDHAILRAHPPLKHSKFIWLRECLAKVDVELKGRSSKSLQNAIESTNDHPLRDEISAAIKHNLAVAEYCCNFDSSIGEAPSGHYALSMEFYTHFTSPIRRYADIVAHRQLLCALEVESMVKGSHRHGVKDVNATPIKAEDLDTAPFFASSAEVAMITEECNARRLAARSVDDASLGLFFCEYLKSWRSLWAACKPEEPFVPRVEAVVVHMLYKPRRLVLYARCVGMEVTVSLKSKSQKFLPDPAYAKQDAKPGVESSSLSSRRNERRDIRGRRCQSEAEKSWVINWGPHPETNEVVEETVGCFTTLSVVLTIKKEKGYEGLDMIIDPPWMRGKERVEIPTSLC